jgi:hypothetical protein
MPNTSVQSRLACDRCHAHKLRCQRHEGHGSCVRCTRAGTACVFSPRQRRTVGTRQVQRQSEATSCTDQSFDPDLDLDLDLDVEVGLWGESGCENSSERLVGKSMTVERAVPGAFQLPNDGLGRMDADDSLGFGAFDWSRLMAFDGQTRSAAATAPLALPSEWNSAPEAPAGTGPLDINGNPAGADIRQVSTLPKDTTTAATKAQESTAAATSEASPDPVHYVRELADLNVSLYEHASKLPAVTMVPTDRAASLDGQLFAIDETFRMTQSLIDLIKTLYRPPHPGNWTPDQGTLLLIMSCTNRVFDVYEVIFGHMRGCIQHNITPVTSEGKTIVLPQVRIGSFAPPTPSAIAMHMLLIVLMASELFSELQDVLGCWRHNKLVEVDSPRGERVRKLNSPGAETGPEFTDEVSLEMARRARAVAGEITRSRDLLLSIPDLAAGAMRARALIPPS